MIEAVIRMSSTVLSIEPLDPTGAQRMGLNHSIIGTFSALPPQQRAHPKREGFYIFVALKYHDHGIRGTHNGPAVWSQKP